MSYRERDYSQNYLLSLFSGCGGLDLGFEELGFETGLAFDLRKAAINSHNHNRKLSSAHVADVTKIKLDELDARFGREFDPIGVIGGPPCQSFSRGNSRRSESDPRSTLVREFFSLALKIHKARSGLDFIVMENVLEVMSADSGKLLNKEVNRLKRNGFEVFLERTNASDFGVAQNRHRLILVALNKKRIETDWAGPIKTDKRKTVRDVIGLLAEPINYTQFRNGFRSKVHPNHWCMTPKSKKFFDGSLSYSRSSGRSFKVLDWDRPSYTVSYGHREVHVHPEGRRRLSVYEAMLLQGFPSTFVLTGTLSEQISQVSEAVPPPLAASVARAIKTSLGYGNKASYADKAAA